MAGEAGSGSIANSGMLDAGYAFAPFVVLRCRARAYAGALIVGTRHSWSLRKRKFPQPSDLTASTFEQEVDMSTCVRIAIAGLGLAAAVLAVPTMAKEGGLAVGVTAGTLGLGPEISWRPNERFGLRANAGFFDVNRDEELDDIEYDAKLKLNSFGAVVDWYPFGGGFRLSGGGRINNNKVTLVGAPTTSVEIGDTTYTPAQVGTVNGTIKGKDFAPTFSLGYGGKFAPGLTFAFELGVMMQGSPEIDLAATGGTLSTNPTFLQQLALESQRAEDDADDYKLWPIVQIGLAYRY